MAASSTEMELNRIEASEERALLCENPIPGTELTLRAVYYPINDALAFDFGQGKPSFDLPDPDGIMTWKVGRDSNTVVGFAIVGVTKFDISQITVNLQVRRECIEENIKNLREEIGSGRARRVLIEKVAVAATTKTKGAGRNLSRPSAKRLAVFAKNASSRKPASGRQELRILPPLQIKEFSHGYACK